jgi:Spy/CpxP family protein refolding chaperone
VGEFFSQARALDLKDDQKEKLDKIDEDLFGEAKEDEEVKNALKEFGALLIDGVKAGRVDTAKLAPHYATLDKAAKDRHEAEAKALNELHEILDAAQRKALAEGLHKRHPGQTKKPPAPAPAPKPAKPPTAPKPPAAQPDKNAAAERLKRRVARVAALLGLDEMQQKRVQPILVRFDVDPLNKTHREQVEKRMQTLITAFEKDEFDATKLDLGKGPKARMENRVAFITSLLAILKADQRDKLARTIERPGARRWGAAIAGEAAPADDE